MFEVKTYECPGDNFLAGTMKIVKEALDVNDGQTIVARSLVKVADGKASAYTAEDVAAEVVPYGVAAEDAENGKVVVYMTGEFFGSKLILPEGVEVSAVKPLLRSNGIFIKELN